MEEVESIEEASKRHVRDQIPEGIMSFFLESDRKVLERLREIEKQDSSEFDGSSDDCCSSDSEEEVKSKNENKQEVSSGEEGLDIGDLISRIKIKRETIDPKEWLKKPKSRIARRGNGIGMTNGLFFDGQLEFDFNEHGIYAVKDDETVYCGLKKGDLQMVLEKGVFKGNPSLLRVSYKTDIWVLDYGEYLFQDGKIYEREGLWKDGLVPPE